MRAAGRHDVPVPTTATPAATPAATDRRAGLAVLLVASAALQLAGQVVLRTSHGWTVSHLLLALAALGLLAVVALLAAVIGPGPGTWAGVAAAVVGLLLTLAVLAIDLDLASAPVEVLRKLDTWDFLAVAGLVVLLLELRRVRPDVGLGAGVALLGLAVPPVEGLVVVAAAAVVVGFVALARDLVTSTADSSSVSRWLSVAVLVAYAVAGTLSWPRAVLAIVVLAWTVAHLRPRAARP